MANYDMLSDITGKTALQPRKKDVAPDEPRRLAYYIGHEFLQCIRSEQIATNVLAKVSQSQ